MNIINLELHFQMSKYKKNSFKEIKELLEKR